MAELHLGLKPDPELEPKRAKTLVISICIHIALLGFLVLNPDLLVQAPKRTIRIAGQDYDLSKEELTPLVMPPRPKPQAVPPASQTPPPQQAAAQPPPPPQPPQPPPPKPKETPPPVITPDMTLATGARLDGKPKASLGSTPEIKNGTEGTTDLKDPGKAAAAAKAAEQQKEAPIQIAANRNPNAIRIPDLLNQAGKIVQDSIRQEQRGGGTPGPRTGIPSAPVQENPDFSTEVPTILSPTYGYDFGPYLNQVVSRIQANWYSLIPEIAKFKRGRVMVVFTIEKNGIVAGAHIVVNSGENPLDRAAFGSITASNPFPRIPPDFVGDHIDLQITFLYNIKP